MPTNFKAAFMDDAGNIVGYARLEVYYGPKMVTNVDGTKSILMIKGPNGLLQPQIVQHIKVIK